MSTSPLSLSNPFSRDLLPLSSGVFSFTILCVSLNLQTRGHGAMEIKEKEGNDITKIGNYA